MMTELYLVRHGEPELKNALLGSTDSPLSAHGWKQLKETFGQLENCEQLVASTLSRCAVFAGDYAEKQDIPLILDDGWRECHFGQWDGLTFDQLRQRFGERADTFFNDPSHHTPPEAEPLMDFSQRVETALFGVLQQFRGQPVAILTHSGVIRTLVAWCLQMDYSPGLQFSRFAVDYGSLTHICVYHDDEQPVPQLIYLNRKPILK